jgi:hypothetical protein
MLEWRQTFSSSGSLHNLIIYLQEKDSTQSYSRFSVTKWSQFIMKESLFSAKKAFDIISFTLYVTWLTVCKRQTNAILNKIMDLFHNEIISFCLWKATVRLAEGYMYSFSLVNLFSGVSCLLPMGSLCAVSARSHVLPAPLLLEGFWSKF